MSVFLALLGVDLTKVCSKGRGSCSVLSGETKAVTGAELDGVNVHLLSHWRTVLLQLKRSRRD